jgi:hypothetical protein
MKFRRLRYVTYSAISLALLITAGCGSHSGFTPQPIILSVSINNTTVQITSNAVPLGVPVTIMAPTETATFSMIGLPSGLSYSYKESESNPSGLLTLTAATTTVSGTYKPTITVGSSGQTASITFTMVVSAPAKTSANTPGNLQDK